MTAVIESTENGIQKELIWFYQAQVGTDEMEVIYPTLEEVLLWQEITFENNEGEINAD